MIGLFMLFIEFVRPLHFSICNFRGIIFKELKNKEPIFNF